MRWPPFEHVFFDCDSTLSRVEGIDVLAEAAGKGRRVEILTQAAMDGKLELEEVYSKRLQAVRPSRKQVTAIRQVYKQNVVEDAAAVIAALQAAGHQVYIISGGLAEPVREFGIFLGVPADHIRAVDVRYNTLSGRWWDTREEFSTAETRYLEHEEGALTLSDGKAEVVRQLLGDQPGRSLLIGDGYSDLLAGRAVDLFVGYGGVVRRELVQAQAPVFLHSPSLAPLLALAGGPSFLFDLLSTPHKWIAEKARHLLTTGVITFQDERLNEKFQQAYQAVHSRPH